MVNINFSHLSILKDVCKNFGLGILVSMFWSCMCAKLQINIPINPKRQTEAAGKSAEFIQSNGLLLFHAPPPPPQPPSKICQSISGLNFWHSGCQRFSPFVTSAFVILQLYKRPFDLQFLSTRSWNRHLSRFSKGIFFTQFCILKATFAWY